MKKINLISFSTSNWRGSMARLASQVSAVNSSVNMFSSFTHFTETDLGEEFYSYFRPFVNDYALALFAWKPFIILKGLNAINDGDCLMYLDGGCCLPVSDCRNFHDTTDKLTDTLGRSRFRLGVGHYYNFGDRMNVRIVRKQVLEKFGLMEDREFLFNYPHYEAGVLLMFKDEQTVRFMRDWYAFMKDNYQSAVRSDFFDKSGQYPQFLHNGSDQAVMQCMLYESEKAGNPHFSLGTYFYDFGIPARLRG